MESLRKRSSVAAAMVACALAGPAFAQLLPAALPVNPGELVHTLEAPNDLVPPPCAGGADLDDPVVLLFNVNNPAAQGAILDTNWSANRVWNAGAGVHEWTARNLGNVFGVCLDRTNNPNIYVANANYVLLGFGGFGQVPLWGPGGPGGVYQLHGTSAARAARPMCAMTSTSTTTGSSLKIKTLSIISTCLQALRVRE